MLFFQMLLFGGYLYAHALKSYFSPTLQGIVHLMLLSAAALALPIEPSDAWKPTGSESPTIFLLWMLLCHVGLPYFVLSSTGPLIQAWLSYQDSSDNVYRLYALSNAGSLVALLSYPFFVEPFLSVSLQSDVWSLMFCGFVLVQGYIAAGLLRQDRRITRKLGEVPDTKNTRVNTSIGATTKAGWIALPAFASTILLVVTNHVCQDVAVIPFLWVLPLSLYLLSFIICFDSPHWYRPKWIATVTMLSIVAIQAKDLLPGSLQLITEASCYMVLLLGVCLLCHGEVARIKPPAEHLTQYYAMLSAGGAIGGLIVAVVCPIVFNSFAELPLSLSIASAFTFLVFASCRNWKHAEYDWNAARRLKYGAALLMIAPLVTVVLAAKDETIASERNFFGVLRVLKNEQGIRLVHGSTIHGMQRHGEVAGEPTTYYGYQSGVGLTLTAMQESSESIRTCVIGLGCGVLATYGRPADEFDMVEINPAVLEIAKTEFTFMKNCPSTIRNHLGDGRLVLERLDDSPFDLLVLDAFSSDAIPAHLLTTEAFQLYRQRMAKNGMMAIHVSNNHLDLVPLVHRLANYTGFASRVVRAPGDEAIGTKHSTWMLIADKSHVLWKHDSLLTAESASEKELATAPLWTDGHHDLVSVLRLW